MKKAILRDSGWKAEVEILEDKSDQEWEKYKVRVIKTIRPSRYFGARPDGDIFEIGRNRQYAHYSDWSLEEI